MGIRTSMKGVKQSFTDNVVPGLKQFKADAKERAREAKIEYLTAQLEAAKNPPVEDEVAPPTPAEA